MTVRELIEALSRFKPDAVVILEDGDPYLLRKIKPTCLADGNLDSSLFYADDYVSGIDAVLLS